MNGTLFGMGLPEILAIAVLTLLVFGPDRLPGLMRNFGRGVRKMREVYTALSAEVQKELGPYAKEIDEATRDLRKDINSIREITDVRNLIPPISLIPPEEAKADAPAPPTGPTIGGVHMAAVNETPLSFPPFDPQPGQQAAVAAEIQQNQTPADANTSPPATPEAAANPPPENSIALHPVHAGVALSDDNPWKS
ncbi:MAG: twin-arginine translocase TatA/TatE family subunit [Thermoflexales bacterium]